MKSNGLSVLQSLLQKYIDFDYEHVRAAGLTLFVWEEQLLIWKLTLASDVVVQTWLSDESLAQSVAMGHKALYGKYDFWVSSLSLIQSSSYFNAKYVPVPRLWQRPVATRAVHFLNSYKPQVLSSNMNSLGRICNREHAPIRNDLTDSPLSSILSTRDEPHRSLGEFAVWATRLGMPPKSQLEKAANGCRMISCRIQSSGLVINARRGIRILQPLRKRGNEAHN